MVAKRVIDFFCSLRLTVACLAMALILVFFGTLAQVDLGLYEVQTHYFRSLFVYWNPKGTAMRIPIWPGGWLLGGVLLVNLLAAHFKRFTFTKNKIGIFLIHAGLILLLIGQFTTELLQVESSMRIEEGQTKNYSEDNMRNELVVIDRSAADSDQLVGIPESLLAGNREFTHPSLPFTIKVRNYYPNSEPTRPMADGATPLIEASEGAGTRLKFISLPLTRKMNEINIPTALVEIVGKEGSLGTWTATGWLTQFTPIGWLKKNLGPELVSNLTQPQLFDYAGHSYEIALRPIRYYKPFSLHLLDFTHDSYIGTDIPKNYASRVVLENPQTSEHREIKIFMNSPLRYGGETYYQGSFEPGDQTTILFVVRNPAWLTPYVSCALVGVGLLVQFLSHLLTFTKRISKQSAQPASGPARPPDRRRPKSTPSAAAAAPVVQAKRSSS